AQYKQGTAKLEAAAAGVDYDPQRGQYLGTANPSYLDLPNYLSDKPFSAVGFSAIGPAPRGIDEEGLRNALANNNDSGGTKARTKAVKELTEAEKLYQEVMADNAEIDQAVWQFQ